MTIARMELMGAIIGTRALLYVKQQLALLISKQILWSDSKCVPFWISKENKTLKKFIDNRIRKIQRKDMNYRFVPGKTNPADIAIRGMPPDMLKSSKIW